LRQDVVRGGELEPGRPGRRFARRELDVAAFGIDWFELPPNAVEASTTSESVLAVYVGRRRRRVLARRRRRGARRARHRPARRRRDTRSPVAGRAGL